MSCEGEVPLLIHRTGRLDGFSIWCSLAAIRATLSIRLSIGKERVERLLELEDHDTSSEIVSPRNNKEAAPMISQ